MTLPDRYFFRGRLTDYGLSKFPISPRLLSTGSFGIPDGEMKKLVDAIMNSVKKYFVEKFSSSPIPFGDRLLFLRVVVPEGESFHILNFSKNGDVTHALQVGTLQGSQGCYHVFLRTLRKDLFPSDHQECAKRLSALRQIWIDNPGR